VFVAGLVFASFSLGLAGCTPLRSFFQSKKNEHGQEQRSALQPKPQVTNAFAYARYVALHMNSQKNAMAGVEKNLTPEEVQEALFSQAVSSRLSAAELLQFMSSKNQLAEKQSEEKSTSVLRFEEFEFQLSQCTSTQVSRTDCCRALAWPAAVLPRWGGMSPDLQRKLLDSAGSSSDKAAELLSWTKLSARDDQNNANQAALSYQLAGLKAWLSSCHGALSGAPALLSDFLQSMAADLKEPSRWKTSLHVKSRAKRLPRRIHARTDGRLSFAETLNADCSIQETEVIRVRPDGALDYWVYDASGKLSPTSHFPAPKSDKSFETVEKLAPDSCMGCHYDFETRHFDRLKVSADELRLPKTSELPVRCLAEGEIPAEDN
jgi:hypothetical protein